MARIRRNTRHYGRIVNYNEPAWIALNLIAHQVEAGYVRPRDAALFTVVEDPRGVFDAIAQAPEPAIPDASLRL